MLIASSFRPALGAALALVLSAGVLGAQPSGRLNVNGSLQLLRTGSDFFVNVLDGAAPFGAGKVGAANTGSFAGLNGAPVIFRDHSAMVGGPAVAGFMTVGGFTFDLQQLFAGVGSNTLPAMAAAGQRHSPSASALNFRNVRVQANSSLSALTYSFIGTVTGPTGTANFEGVVSAQYAGLTLQQVHAAAGTPAGASTSFSASFLVTPVPEPGSVALVATGLLGVVGMGVLRRRRVNG